MNEIPKLFALWLGTNEMSDIRRSAYESLSNSGLDVVLITRETLPRFIDVEQLHPAYEHLNLAHRADYLRAYLMHVFGGGYTDIKWIDTSWLPTVAKVESCHENWAAGYPEASPSHVANIDWYPPQWQLSYFERSRLKLEKRLYKYRYNRLIGNGAFYFKPDTPITRHWWREVNRRLERLAPALALNPARNAKEKPGDIVDGAPSRYPVPWTFLLGSILHPLTYRYRHKILQELPPPIFDHPDLGNYGARDFA